MVAIHLLCGAAYGPHIRRSPPPQQGRRGAQRLAGPKL